MTDVAANGTAVAPPVHVFTDDQFKALLATVTPGPSVVARAGSVVKMGATDVVAGAEKVGSEVSSHLPLIAFVTAVASIAMQLVPLVAAHIK